MSAQAQAQPRVQSHAAHAPAQHSHEDVRKHMKVYIGVFLALLVTFIVHRTRRRMGLPVSSRLWVTIVVGFVLIVLTAWVASAGRH